MYLAKNYTPIVKGILSGKGSYLFQDLTNKIFLDFFSGYGALPYGHSNQHLIASAVTQLNDLTLTGRCVETTLLENWAKKITKKFSYDTVLPTNSGAEGVESAIGLSRKFGHKIKGVKVPEIISFRNNFHGRTLGALSLSSNEKYRDGRGPFPEGFKLATFNDIQSVKNVLSPNTSAIFIEPIQGEGGINVANKDFMSELRDITIANDILLVVDEVQCGFGRTGKLTAYSHYYEETIKPDILILAKGIGGGIIPISCILTSYRLMELYESGTHGSTFGGNPLSCAVSSCALDMMNDNVLLNVQNKYKMLSDHFDNKILRGVGLMAGIKINSNSSFVLKRLTENGLITTSCGPNGDIIRITPQLLIKENELLEGIKIIKSII